MSARVHRSGVSSYTGRGRGRSIWKFEWGCRDCWILRQGYVQRDEAEAAYAKHLASSRHQEKTRSKEEARNA